MIDHNSISGYIKSFCLRPFKYEETPLYRGQEVGRRLIYSFVLLFFRRAFVHGFCGCVFYYFTYIKGHVPVSSNWIIENEI